MIVNDWNGIIENENLNDDKTMFKIKIDVR